MKVLAFGEVMMRLTPPDFKRISQTDNLDLSFTGTGLNILAGLAQNGNEVSILTALPDNNLGKAAASEIRKLNVNDSNIIYNGNQIGTYILEIGFGNRPSEVTYLDRTVSSFNTIDFSDEKIIKALNGVDLLHICGIALSTSEKSRKAALKLVEIAAEKKIKICFDFNFRESLNKESNRSELIKSYENILHKADIVFGSQRDLVDLLEIEGTSDEEINQKFVSKYNIPIFSGTLRIREELATYLIGFIYENKELIISEKIKYDVLDRIGTGDAYVAGILTGLFEGWPNEQIVQFATNAAALAHTTVGDTPILDKKFVTEFINNRVDVIR